MRYGSVCSGVEAATAAWHPLGWSPQWFSEIDKFPSAVLAHHYPDVPNLGDMTKFKEWPIDRSIDLLVGGTPCQSFSIAGLRKGLEDPRGNLMLTYLAMAEQLKPKWLVWENVPGVLSSNGGKDFGTFLSALGEIGYGFSWRILDAQYFGVPQRRRRLFVVGHLGNWKRAAAVLFERESMSGHPAPSREAGQNAAPTVTQGAPFSRTGNERVEAEAVVAQCLTTRTGSAYDPTTETLPVTGFDAYNNQATGEVSKTIDTGQDYHHVPIVFGAQNSANQGDSVSTEVTPTPDKSKTPAVAMYDPVPPLMARSSRGAAQTLSPGYQTDGHMVSMGMQVRRLTPIECERLQGFPDNFTQIPWRNKAAEDCPDGPRYKAMGNSMAVPVMRWIGERIHRQ